MSVYDELLPYVNKPSGYLGDEINSVHKDHASVQCSVVLAHPDLYEMGMSHIGLNILYDLINRDERFVCERVFSPGMDYEALLRERDLPLASLESQTPLRDFDILGVTLPHELCYTNVVGLLDLSGVPIRATDRDDSHPIVIAGGSAAFNPEPVAPFFDAVVIGDGELVILRICEAVIRLRGRPRGEVLEALSRIQGVYIPSFFEPRYGEDGRLAEIRPLKEDQPSVRRAVLTDLGKGTYPEKLIVPFQQLVHDRISMEIMRGCTVGCRFCQAGYTYRPVRERKPEEVIRLINTNLRNTGHDEVSLLSLSSGDYCKIDPLLETLMKRLAPERVAMSLPSLRVATLTPSIVGNIKEVRRTGFTIAPEAGTERMRRIINKPVDDRDILKVVANVFSQGWRRIKFYFMIGLPFEEEADLDGIIRIAKASRDVMRQSGKGAVTVSVSTFVPKPITPFQWSEMIDRQTTLEKQAYLRKGLRDDGIVFKCHDSELSYIEGIFSRGDRRLADVLETAYRLGCRFDSWSDHFRPELWASALEKCGVEPEKYFRERDLDEVLPWDHLDAQVAKPFLIEELEKGRREAMTGDCRWHGCPDCGICFKDNVRNITFPKVDGMPAPAIPRQDERKQPWTRLRLRYRKTGRCRFLSHLEVARCIQRAIRRAAIRVRYSQGFHPKPRLSFGPPLSVGYESDSELFDAEVIGSPDPQGILERLNPQLPGGLQALAVEQISRKDPSIFNSLSTTTYRIVPDTLPATASHDIEAFMAKDVEVIRQLRKGKMRRLDLRAQVESLTLEGGEIELVLHQRQDGSAKAAEIVRRILGLPEECEREMAVRKVGVTMTERSAAVHSTASGRA
ncbi:MAG: TIGR03960 family B12-binding radical SAM protein [Planctomycetota bacterium]|nr:TIGR03960 family B12-binding radical SAM protein [Planctomycetota bacterium]